MSCKDKKNCGSAVVDFPPDLKLRDWVIETSKKTIQKIDPTVKFSVIMRGPSKMLAMSNISHETLEKMSFMTNDNTKSNYLYLEKFDAYTDNQPSNLLELPGLSQLMKEHWKDADTEAFISTNSKMFKPFNKPFRDPNDTTKSISVKEFIDIHTGMIPFSHKTKNVELKFIVVVNPDCTSGSCSSDYVSSQCCCGWSHQTVFGIDDGVCCNSCS